MADEYICRQEMLDAVEKLNIIPSIDGMGKPTPTEDFRVQFLGTVLHVPSADVVQVVRCRDCKYSHMTYDGKCKYCDIWFPDEDEYMDGDYFCASAEQR